MRIATGTTDQYIYFVAVDDTDFTTRETGLSSFTVYRSRNGAAAAAMTTPTINETDATNMPGVYELLLNEDMTIGAGNETEEMAFHITHAGMAPVTRVIELFEPTAAATEPPTVSAIADAVWDELQSAHTTAGTFGEMATETAAIQAKTDQLTFSTANRVDSTAKDVDTGAIDSGSFAIGSITSAAFGANAITSTVLATDSITSDEIAASAVTEIQTGLATASALATVDANVDAILVDTGTDIPARFTGIEGATFDTATDSLEAIRDRGDAAWTTGAGGGGGDATEAKQDQIISLISSGEITVNTPHDPTTNEITIVRGASYDDVGTHPKFGWAVTKDYTGGDWTGTFTIRHRTTRESLLSKAITITSAVLLNLTLDASDTDFTELTEDDEWGNHYYDITMVHTNGTTVDKLGPFIAHLVRDVLTN